MKSSCIISIPNDPFLIVKESYSKLFQGNWKTSMLLSFFEEEHNFKVEQSKQAKMWNDEAEKNDEKRTQDESLYLHFTLQELQDVMMGVLSRRAINNGLSELEEYCFISCHKNPKQDRSFDHTPFYLFHPEIVSAVLQKWNYNYE